VTGAEEEPTATDQSASDAASWPVRRPAWVAHVLDDENEPAQAVLLHLPSGRRTALSDTGTAMWQVIVASGADGVTARDIGGALAPEYGVDAEVIAQDVGGLLAEMLDDDWLEVVPDQPHQPEQARGEGTGP
jgi:hypothetical protein